MVEGGKQDFTPLIENASRIEDAYYSSQALAWMGRSMSKAGLDSTGVFSEAVGNAAQVDPAWRRAEILVQVGSEMSKAGVKDFGELLNAIGTIDSLEHRQNALKTLQRRIKRAGLSLPELPMRGAGPQEKKRPHGKKDAHREGLIKRITLGLLNTYSGNRLQEPHVRAIARAAQLCYAFDLNLCLFGFPAGEAPETVSTVEEETRVGGGGSYLRRLFEEGRFSVRELPRTPVLESMDRLVAATSSPDVKKEIEMEEIRKGDHRYCVLVGLGSRGLPRGILKTCDYHLELTGKKIPLETCTAMGVLAAKLALSRATDKQVG